MPAYLIVFTARPPARPGAPSVVHRRPQHSARTCSTSSGVGATCGAASDRSRARRAAALHLQGSEQYRLLTVGHSYSNGLPHRSFAQVAVTTPRNGRVRRRDRGRLTLAAALALTASAAISAERLCTGSVSRRRPDRSASTARCRAPEPGTRSPYACSIICAVRSGLARVAYSVAMRTRSRSSASRALVRDSAVVMVLRTGATASLIARCPRP